MKPDIKAKLKYVGNTLPIYSVIRPIAKIKDGYLTVTEVYNQILLATEDLQEARED